MTWSSSLLVTFALAKRVMGKLRKRFYVSVGTDESWVMTAGNFGFV